VPLIHYGPRPVVLKALQRVSRICAIFDGDGSILGFEPIDTTAPAATENNFKNVKIDSKIILSLC